MTWDDFPANWSWGDPLPPVPQHPNHKEIASLRADMNAELRKENLLAHCLRMEARVESLKDKVTQLEFALAILVSDQ